MSPLEALVRLTVVIVVDIVALASALASIVLLLLGHLVAFLLFLAGGWLLALWCEREAERIPEPPR